MLYLHRSVGKSIIINGNIEVIVAEITQTRNGLSVCLGIIAPKDVVVDREEVRDRKLKEAKLQAHENQVGIQDQEIEDEKEGAQTSQ